MSDDRKDEPSNVGYCRPPKEHQFKAGKSGNPRGRPLKTERSYTLRQIYRDILAITEGPTKIRVGHDVVTTTVIEALLRRAVQRGFEGHGPSMRFVFGLHERALTDHSTRYEKEFSFLEMVETEEVIQPVRTDDRRYFQAMLNGLRSSTRRI
jgi:hypothetical protein